MGLPSRSFAADAHDCIMVWIRMDPPNTRVWRDVPRLMASSPRIITQKPWSRRGTSARTAGGYVDNRRRRPAPLPPLPEQAHMTRAWSRGRITGASKRLQLLRYPRSKPICATRPVSEHGQPHMRSPLIAAAPRSRFRRAGLRKTRTILESGISGHGLLRFVYLDPPGLIRSWEMTGLRWCIR